MAFSERKIQVAIVLYDDVDILDFTGPLEVFNAARHPGLENTEGLSQAIPAFATTLLGRERITSCESGLSINVQKTFGEVLGDLGEFDVLVVPGANPKTIQALLKEQHPVIDFIARFIHQGTKYTGGSRTILTVCTGALVLAAAGGLKNMTVTTHSIALDLLRQAEPSATVLGPGQHKGRFIDGGNDAHGNRIITAGGVTCGIDASIFTAELLAGKDAAGFARKLIELA